MRAALLCLSVFFTGCAPSIAQASDRSAPTALQARAECPVGLYGTRDRFVVVTKDGQGLRYGFSDGRADSLADNEEIACVEGKAIKAGDKTYQRFAIKVTPTRFEAGGFMLAGQLLEPVDAGPQTSLVVFAHGSEERGWIERARDPYQMVGRGVSVFVYDKRGTGLSEGQYSQNFPQLADDLVAASAEAKRLAKGRFTRFGLIGLSQGGWIAPLAANRAQADFLGIGYGLVVDILEEDAAQVELELREAGYDDEVLAKARRLTDVTARLAVSGYRDGLEELDRLRDLYREEPWFAGLKGGFSGVILGMPSEELRTQGIPMFDRLDIDWSLKPMDVLREVEVPQLWALAGKDREAPIESTLSRLKTLRGEAKSITIRVFPEADHGMWEFNQDAAGNRSYTQITPGFHDLMADWAKGELKPRYGASVSQ
ncbi:MAG: alpha/beta hydrolase [Pseudomonadota bacterium]